MSSDQYRHLDEMPASHQAAEQVVPVILSVTGPVRSVVDVGGGDGGWLSVFLKHGVEQALLLDSADVAPHLLIDRANFQPVDLSRELPPPRRFDLAMSLECAEHLPAHRAAPLVEWLTKSAPIVVFSAAIPGQGGKGHINEQPPDYWNDLFRRQGFQRHDVLRSRILDRQAVPWWYRQNLFLFTSPEARPIVREPDFLTNDEFCLVHRNMLVNYQHPALRSVLSRVGPAFVAAIQRRIKPSRPADNHGR